MDLSTRQNVKILWQGQHTQKYHLYKKFSSMQSISSLVDMSLICQTGKMIMCHKIVLAAASPYLYVLLSDLIDQQQHVVVILPNIGYSELLCIVEYLYRGDSQPLRCQDWEAVMYAASCLQVLGFGGYRKKEEEEPQDLSVRGCSNTFKRRRKVDEKNSDVGQSRQGGQKDNQKGWQKIEKNNNITEKQKTPKVNPSLKTSKQTKKPSSPNGCQSQRQVPSWSQSQLCQAIECVITQQMRFTQASSNYGIPKGTLYDNILGKSKRMKVLEQVGLTESQDLSVLEFCCQVSSMPYNRRTTCSLKDVRQLIINLKRNEGHKDFQLSPRHSFQWWWAFTKKHNIISLYYQHQGENMDTEDTPRGQTSSPHYIHHLLNLHPSVSMNTTKLLLA